MRIHSSERTLPSPLFQSQREQRITRFEDPLPSEARLNLVMMRFLRARGKTMLAIREYDISSPHTPIR